MMAEENKWHRFFRMFSENPEKIRASPAYNFMVSENGRLLIVKAVEGAMTGPTKHVRMHAAIVLQELSQTNVINNAYTHFPTLALPSLRCCALRLMVVNEVGTDLQEAGFLLAADLLRQALLNYKIEDWPELRLMMDRAFTDNLDILDHFIDLVCKLYPNHDYMSRFVKFLAPSILRNLDPFINTLRGMLEQGEDHGVFLLLPYLYAHLPEAPWKTLLTAAIMTPFFHNETQSSYRVIAAFFLEWSVKTTAYSFSRDWLPHMNAITTVLLNIDRRRPSDSREMTIAIRLKAAMSTKHYD